MGLVEDEEAWEIITGLLRKDGARIESFFYEIVAWWNWNQNRCC